ncbi:WYL domain-containing protein [Cohnella sp. CFH 77786]|uniref:helix-turn-helix transcriptional regulator n=1 Tax=Cohnella sp. CFH 77786 TaxID=2662265 RepID=UPI001C60B91B|nr:YafY family protein [Cohnella sp. CFH 77786]MBW5445959.1 WYL domain-containing protein [Cohnella sp. CFH 77786]
MKLDRLLAITMLLLNRKRVSAKELADRFEVSLRTVYRDVETIQMAGIPVVSYAGTSGGYEIMDRYRLDRQMLSFEELNSIVVALRGIRTTLDDREIEPLLDKVGALLGKSEHERLDESSDRLAIDINPWSRGAEDKEKLTGLREAIRDRKVIRFEYTNAEGDRTSRSCEPMKLVLKGYVWYVYGYCLLRRDFRIFRLSRIRELDITGPVFVRREMPATDNLLRWDRMIHESVLDLVLQFAPKMRARVVDEFEPASIEDMPDGSVRVRFSRPDGPWLYRYLLGFGTDVRVLQPAETALKLRAEAEKIVKMYSES